MNLPYMNVNPAFKYRLNIVRLKGSLKVGATFCAYCIYFHLILKNSIPRFPYILVHSTLGHIFFSLTILIHVSIYLHNNKMYVSTCRLYTPEFACKAIVFGIIFLGEIFYANFFRAIFYHGSIFY